MLAFEFSDFVEQQASPINVCIDCKHCAKVINAIPGYPNIDQFMCVSPYINIKRVNIDKVTGVAELNFGASCKEQRTAQGQCGYEGKHFINKYETDL